MRHLRLLPILVAALFVVAVLPAGTMPAPVTIRIGYPTWVGYGPLFLAQAKGFYQDVKVELVKMEDIKPRFAALAARRIDGSATTLDAMTLYVKPELPLVAVLALDDSKGGDGIVARKEIRSIQDLKGKRVAFTEGSVSHFFLSVLLRENGLTEKDIVVVNMTAGDAGAAFVAGKVDAAVTWEPWLTKGKQAPHGHLLIDSSKTPGLIVDALVFRKDVVREHPEAIMAITRGWHRAVEYWKKNPAESNAIMAKAVGGWLNDPKVFAETLTGIRYYDYESNVKFFGTPANPGPAYRTVQRAIDIWTELGKIRYKFTAKDVLDSSFLTK